MSKGTINKVILIGNLGADPETRYMPSGSAVVNLRVATTDSWKDQQGQQQDRTEWHSVTIYGKLGEIAGQYLRKGSKVYLEGRLQTRKWQDKNGQDRYTTEVIANEMTMLDRAVGGGAGPSAGYAPGPAAPRGSEPERYAPPPAPPSAPPPQYDQNYGGRGNTGMDDFDDDIPF